MKWDEDKCSECGHVIRDEDYITEREMREFWGGCSSELMVVGYTCSRCGNEEEF